jgi:hypothetical protein
VVHPLAAFFFAYSHQVASDDAQAVRQGAILFSYDLLFPIRMTMGKLHYHSLHTIFGVRQGYQNNKSHPLEVAVGSNTSTKFHERARRKVSWFFTGSRNSFSGH